eukprot:2703817-Pyramimonas_sp.AAC.1
MGQDKERASLRDLIHPTTSPIVCASASMLRLGRHFHGGEDSPWFLIDLLGGDLNDAKLRLSARRSVLQLAAGLQEVLRGVWLQLVLQSHVLVALHALRVVAQHPERRGPAQHICTYSLSTTHSVDCPMAALHNNTHSCPRPAIP